jgi:hypothetical protein
VRLSGLDHHIQGPENLGWASAFLELGLSYLIPSLPFETGERQLGTYDPMGDLTGKSTWEINALFCPRSIRASQRPISSRIADLSQRVGRAVA